MERRKPVYFAIKKGQKGRIYILRYVLVIFPGSIRKINKILNVNKPIGTFHFVLYDDSVQNIIHNFLIHNF